jgi:hypothetical protein
VTCAWCLLLQQAYNGPDPEKNPFVPRDAVTVVDGTASCADHVGSLVDRTNSFYFYSQVNRGLGG